MKIQNLLSRFGPAIITACVVLGPGSLLVSANIGAKHQYQLLWMLILTGILMAAYVSMAARIGVVGGDTPCTLIAQRLGRIPAAVVGINLCLVCAAFQFGNNLAFATAAQTLLPDIDATWILLALNGLIIIFLFSAQNIYHILERTMKIMVALMLICFLLNLIVAAPSVLNIIKGFVPTIPKELSLTLPEKINGKINDPLILLASLLGTTFSVAGAFYQGNLVREKGWTQKDYKH